MSRFWSVAGFALGLATLCAFQRPFREFPGIEYRVGDIHFPPDYQEKTEWTFARLMYPHAPGGRGFGRFGGYGRTGGLDWTQGNTIWTMDYPRSDRHFVQAVRRLTRIHARSVEQPVNLDEGDVYNWPWLYAVEVGHWESHRRAGASHARIPAARRLLHVRRFPRRQRVGSLHRQACRRSSPTARSSTSTNKRPIFHAVYDLDDRYQVPGAQYLQPRPTLRKATAVSRPLARHLRRPRPPDGRHLPSTWISAIPGSTPTIPHYPEKFSALGIRIGVNYVIYAMTH